MKRNLFFKLGGIAYILLGIMHLLTQLLGDITDPQLVNTFSEMKHTTIQFMGEHTILQFYFGFSITMGFLLFAFGLQTLLIDKPGKYLIIADICISFLVLLLTIKYFHLLASVFIFIALACFTVSLLVNQQKKSADQFSIK